MQDGEAGTYMTRMVGPPSVRYSCEAGTYMTRMVGHPVLGTAVRQGLT